MSTIYSLVNDFSVESSFSLSSDLLSTLEQSLFLAQEQLRAFANNSLFRQQVAVAFGDEANLETFQSAWKMGDFSRIPKLEILDSSILGNANGAYASSTNKIYLSSDFIATATPTALSAVLLEEIGHFVDARVNQTDSAGDEGAIFSDLVQGKNLSQLQLSQLMAEDDSATILLNGQTIQIEKSGTPGFTIIPLTSLVTTEAGGTARVSVQLNTQLTDSVTIPLRSDNVKEGVLDKSSLTFTPTNWNVAQVITITGVDDRVNDGNIAYKIIADPVVSNDLIYRDLGKNPNVYSYLNNKDDDQAGITVTPLTPLVVTEDGGTAQFTLRLNSQPVSPVKVQLTLDRSFEILDKYTLIFTSENWDQPQTVTVTGSLDGFSGNGGGVLHSINVEAVNQDSELATAEGRFVTGGFVIDVPSGDGYDIDARLSTVVDILKYSIVYQQSKTYQLVDKTLYFSGTSGNDVLSYTDYSGYQPFSYRKFLGQDGNDFLGDYTGGVIHDEVYGQGGNDYLIGGSGVQLFGGTGNDTYEVHDSSVTITDESGIDKVISYADSYTLPPNIENLELFYTGLNAIGNDLNNHILGSGLSGGYGSSSSLFGLGGDDTIKGGFGNDTIDGGDGNDTIDGGGGNDTIDGGNGNDIIEGGLGNSILRGGVGNDVLYGNRLKYSSGTNYLITDNDILEGGEGNDILYGQGGNDVLKGDNGDDKLYGGEGNDILEGGAGNDILYDLFGKNSLKGGLGNDEYTLGITNLTYWQTSEGNTIDDEGGTNDSLKFLTPKRQEGLFTWDLFYTPQSVNGNLFGVKADDTTLWVDTNQDYVIDSNNDLAIKNYYKKIIDSKGRVSYTTGAGYIENMKFVENQQLPDTKPLLIKAINGKFKDDDGDGIWTANGTILIGRQDGIPSMFKVDYANAEISQQNIKFTNGTVYSSIFQIPVPLFTGNFTIPIGTSATSALQEISSLPNEFKPAGLDLSLSKFNLATNQIELQGKVTLPINFDRVVIDITGGNNFVIAEDGFGLTGANIQLPNINFAYENIVKIQATNLSLGWEKDFFKIQGSVDGSSPFLRNAKFKADFSGNNYIKISDNGSNDSRVDVIGSLAVENLSLGKWGINQASVFINTVDGNITGNADIKLPWGLISGLKGTLGFQKSQATWELDSAAIDISGNFTLPILPVISLTKLGGKVSNLSEKATSPIIFDGNATLEAKATGFLTTILPAWVGKQFSFDSAGTFTVNGKVDENRLVMGGNVSLIGGLLSGEVKNLQVDWTQKSITAKLEKLSVLNGLINLEGGFTATSNFDFTAYGEGKVKLPDITVFSKVGLNGKEILSAGVGVKYFNNNTLSDDSIAGWGSVLSFIKVGVEVSLEGKVTIIGAKEIEAYKPTTIPAEGSIPLDITANNIQGNLPDDSTLYQILESALPNAYSYLQKFASSPEFVTTMNLAFDSNWNKTVGYQIAQTWAVGNFDNIPIIKMISAANIGGANAAFADSTNTIYIAKEYLAYHSSNLDSLTDVLLEEIGHWVDAQVNSIDTIGDEGAIFSSLLRHQTLSNQQLAQLKAEDDTLTITLDGINTQLNLNSSQQDSFSIASNTPWLLLAINWENGTSNVPFEIQAPDGKIYTEADLIGSQTISVVNELSSSTCKVLRIDMPDAGIWKIKLPDTTNLGKVGFSSLGGLEAPTIAITGLQQEINSSNVIINYDINNIDANAQISFYYDVDNNGFNGNLIGVVNPQSEGLGKYTWNTQSVNLGNYYIYALVSDNNRIPTSAYSLNGITLTNTPVNNPPTLQNKILNQTALEDSVFSFTIPTNTFNDIDAGDILTYSATLENGNALPSWLTFNPTTRTLSGTPINSEVGSLNIRIMSADNAGANVSDIFTLTVQNVNDAPIVSNPIPAQTATEDSPFNFAIPANTFSDIDAGDTLTYSATLANGTPLTSWLTFNPITGIFTGTPLNENVGIISVIVTATDTSNASVSNTFTIAIANVNDAPALTSTPATLIAGTEDTPYTISTSSLLQGFTDVDGDSLAVSELAASNGTLTDNGNGTYNFAPKANFNGIVNLTYNVIDSNGGITSATQSFAIASVNDAPIVSNAIAAQTATEDSPFSFAIPTNTFNDVDAGDILTYSATLADGTPLPSWLSFNANTGIFSGTPLNENVGTINVKVTATDTSNASVSNTFAIAIANVNDAPTVSNAIVNQNATEDSPYSFTIPTNTFNDVDAGDKLTYSATLGDGTPLPSWLSFNPTTGKFNGIPLNENVGTLSVKVTATDTANASVSNTFAIAVANVNDAPIVSNPIPAQTATQDSPFSLTIPTNTFNDVDAGDKLTYSAALVDGKSLPNWLNFNPSTGIFSGTPLNADVGNLSIKVTATDTSNASVSNTFAIAIANVNDAPTVSNAIVNQTATEDSPFSFTITTNTFYDVDAGDTLTYSATLANGTPLPSWLTFNANTGKFSGTPLNENVGTLNVKVTATDTSNISVSSNFAIAIANVNDAPTVSNAIVNQTTTENSSFSFTIPTNTFNDVDAGDILTYSATRTDGTTLPSWLVFNATTGAFSGNPTSGDVGTLSIKVTATDLANSNAEDTFDIVITPKFNIINGTESSEILMGTSANDLIFGLAGNDLLLGFAGNDILVGGTGNNLLIGGTGNNILVGGNGKNILVGGDENDTLIGGTGNNILIGGTGNNILIGGDSDDLLIGGDNDDLLIGRAGNDLLVGGTGNDFFAFSTNEVFNTAKIGQDIIADFDTANDKIVLDKITFNSLFSIVGSGFSQSNEFAVVTTDAEAQISGAFITYNNTNGNLFYNQNGAANGLGSGGLFANLNANPSLSASNFLIAV